MVQIRTPQFPESVYEASVGAWFKSPGDTVEAGEAILELHTDKAVQEINAVEAGTVTMLLRQVDDVVQPGDMLCEVEPAGAASIGDSAEVDELATATPEADQDTGQTEAAAEVSEIVEFVDEDEPAPSESTVAVEDDSAADDLIEIDVPQPIPMSAVSAPEPVARSTNIVELDPDVSVIDVADGTPEVDSELVQPDADIVTEVETPVQLLGGTDFGSVGSPELDEAIVAAAERPTTLVRLTRRQLTASRRMVEVQQQTVMTTTINEVDMRQIIEMRTRHGVRFLAQNGVKLGFMSFFVKAVCAALKAYPVLNSEIQEESLLLKDYRDIGIAVASARGLVVPVLRGADTMTFAEIESGIRDFAEKAQSGAWNLSDLAGGTFTITNGGVFGSMLSTPILNPPQVGILGMHNILERPVAIDGQVVIRPMMYVALTYDHRIVEGAQAVQFLRSIKESLESADVLLLGT